jgi:hypothetical protein
MIQWLSIFLPKKLMHTVTIRMKLLEFFDQSFHPAKAQLALNLNARSSFYAGLDIYVLFFSGLLLATSSNHCKYIIDCD